MLTTDQKGVVAELAIAKRAADLGIGVWHSYTIERYDLVNDLRTAAYIVAIKRVADVTRVRGMYA